MYKKKKIEINHCLHFISASPLSLLPRISAIDPLVSQPLWEHKTVSQSFNISNNISLTVIFFPAESMDSLWCAKTVGESVLLTTVS